MKLEFSRQNFEKFSDVKFHENPSIGSNVFYASDRWTDMTMLVAAFRNFAKALTNLHIIRHNPATPSDIMSFHLTTLLVYRVAKR